MIKYRHGKYLSGYIGIRKYGEWLVFYLRFGILYIKLY